MFIDSTLLTEVWEDVSEYETLYQISNWGRVKSLTRLSNSGRKIKERILKQTTQENGYNYVGLCKNGVAQTFRVHQLVATEFIGECPDGMEINHKDGVKTNNHVDNLEYVTPKQNGEHATQTGLTLKGEQIWKTALTPSDILAIREARNNGSKIKPLAQKYGVTVGSIQHIIHKRTWKHI